MTQTPHVAFINARFTPTLCGVGDYTSQLASQLSSMGIRISVLTRKQGCPADINGFKVFETVDHWNLFNMGALKKKIDQLKPDIVHLQYEPFGFRQSYFLPILISRLSLPVIATVHEVWHGKKIHQLRDQFLYRHLNQIIVNDQGCYERLLRLAPEVQNRVAKIGVGSNLPEVHSVSTPQTSELTIGYFGFFNKTKRIDSLIDGFNLFLYKSQRYAKLKLIGNFIPEKDSYHRELSKQVTNLGLKGKVEFTGALSDREVALELSKCNFAVLPFIDGVSPRRGSFQACMALGLPVITSSPETREVMIKNRETAFLVEKITAENLARAMTELASDVNLQRTLSLGAKKFSESFTWNEIAKKHLEIYDWVLPKT